MFLAVQYLVVFLCSWTVGGTRRGYGYRYEDLQILEAAIHRVAAEATFLRERAGMVEMQKTALDSTLDGVSTNDLVPLSDKNTEQYDTIRSIKDTLKAYAHRVGAIESRLEAAVAVSAGLKDRVPSLSAQVTLHQASSVDQNAALTDVNTTLGLTAEKLAEKLSNNAADSGDAIDAVQGSINTCQTHIDTRTCFSTVVEVDMDEMIAQGSFDNPFPPNYFSGNVPTVLCGIQGTVTRGQVGQSQPYTYNDRKRLAVTVDCKAFSDKVRVTAFDQSTESERHGGITEFLFLYVEVRACSYAAQSGF